MTKPVSILYCTFCLRNQEEVQQLIAGPNVFICNECVDLAHSIVHSPKRAEGRSFKAFRDEILGTTANHSSTGDKS